MPFTFLKKDRYYKKILVSKILFLLNLPYSTGRLEILTAAACSLSSPKTAKLYFYDDM